MNRLLYLPLTLIGLAALMVAYRIAQPSHMVIEADNRLLLEGIATSEAAQLAHLTPTVTPYRSPTPTRTPQPPTETPLPTFGAQTTPGLYTYEPPFPTPTMGYAVEDWPLCEALAASPTPMPFRRTCEVKP